MSHRDKDCRIASGSFAQGRTFAQALSTAMAWLLAGVDWGAISLRADCQWSPRGLASAALLWAWSGETSLKERFAQALAVVRSWHCKAPRDTSYQAFMKLLVRWTEPLQACLVAALRKRMLEQVACGALRIAGFLVIGGDGSKLGLCRTSSNEGRFSPTKARRKSKKRRGQKGRRRPKSRKARVRRAQAKKADSPQMSLTVLLLMALGIPWDFRLGASDSSERGHLLQMVSGLPSDALVTADCGFVGYDFWAALLASGRHFVIRVGGNVRLLKKLGVARESEGIVYVWPNQAARRKQPPLMLRLVVLEGPRHPWYLVTSVLNPRRLSDRQVIQIYRQRWGIELFFRHFKQTYQRGKLRSHNAEHALCEAQWSLLGLWSMLLYAYHQRSQACPSVPRDSPPPSLAPRRAPKHVPRASVIRVLRAFRKAMHRYDSRPQRGDSLAAQLRIAVLDKNGRRDKRSRGHPRKKYEPPTKPPTILIATKSQRQLAQHISIQHQTLRLTA